MTDLIREARSRAAEAARHLGDLIAALGDAGRQTRAGDPPLTPLELAHLIVDLADLGDVAEAMAEAVRERVPAAPPRRGNGGCRAPGRRAASEDAGPYCTGPGGTGVL